MLDKLVFLLSTDWFKPYWSHIGLDIDEPSKTRIQQGCRNIVQQILSGAQNYFLASFSEERKNGTRAMFDKLIHESGEDERILKTVQEWDDLSDEEMKAAWICDSLTREILGGAAGDTGLDPLIVRGLISSQPKVQLAPFEFLNKCENSQTSWDRFTRSLTPDLPTGLADDLAAVLTAKGFERMWHSLLPRLTPAKRQDLINWYRSATKARVGRELITGAMK